MPRYFFHLYDSLEARDEEGKVLTDLPAARTHAIVEAREIASADVRSQGRLDLSHWIEVEDERREVMLIVKFSDAVTIESGNRSFPWCDVDA